MTLKLNRCTGTNGTTVSTGNSANPDAWALVSLNSQTCVYDTSVSMHDGSSMRIQSATAASTVQVGWTDTAAASFSCRWYEHFTAYPSATQQHGFNVRGSSGATTLARSEVDTTGHIRIVMQAAGSFSTTVLSLNTWYRFEVEGAAFNSAAGTLTMRIYAGDSTTPLETLNLTAQTTSLTIDTIRFGKFNGAGTVTSYWDSISANIGSSTPQGPYVLTPTVTDAFTLAEGTTNIMPPVTDTFTLAEGTTSFASATGASDGVLLTETATETLANDNVDSSTLSETSSITSAISATDAETQGDSFTQSVPTGESAVSWGGGLTNGYIVAAQADTSDISVGQRFLLYTAGGALKESTLFEVTSLSAPAFGFVNVFMTPDAVVTPANTDVARVVTPAGSRLEMTTGINDSATLTDTSALTQSFTVNDLATLTDSSSLNTGGVDQVANDSATLTDSSSLSRASSVTDSGAVTDVSSLARASLITDSATQAEGATVIGATFTPNDSAALTETVAIAAVLPVGGVVTYRGYTTETPPTAGNIDSNVWLAVEFYVEEDCDLTAAYYWQPTTNTNDNPRWGWLFQGDSIGGTAIAETDHLVPLASGWQRLPYSTPVPLTANTRYRMAVYFQGGGYAATTLFFDTGQPGLHQGPLVIPPSSDAQGNDQNLFYYDSGSPPPYPIDSFNSASYYVDVEVQTGDGPSDVGVDSATLTDTSLVSQLQTANDSATLGDTSQPVAASSAVSDSATQTEGATVLSAAFSVTDAETLTDVSSLNAGGAVTASDTTTLTDISNTIAVVSVTDTATQGDASALAKNFGVNDIATENDPTPSIVVALSVVDDAVQSDSSSVAQGGDNVASDGGTLTDVSSITSLTIANDSATQGDTSDVHVFIDASDGAAQNEGLTAILAALSAVDTVTLADLASLGSGVNQPVTDSAALTEFSSLQVYDGAAVNDAGVLAEQATVAVITLAADDATQLEGLVSMAGDFNTADIMALFEMFDVDQETGYLAEQRRLTHDYIMENPVTLTLTPTIKSRTATGGYVQLPDAARQPQVFRLIEGSSVVVTDPQRTETGFMRERDWQLMGEWDADIAVGDTFTYENRNWYVRNIMAYNKYERRAVVIRVGE